MPRPPPPPAFARVRVMVALVSCTGRLAGDGDMLACLFELTGNEELEEDRATARKREREKKERERERKMPPRVSV